ncbi:ABC transporter ATP-binding protein [Agrilactobacillus fermenti]|uniref:ABC transporter ATP-binding protein n=1 Tax=Agrilactobacillus fermenti TaxID=2586909 RepID=UPI003A5BB864
MTILDLQQVTKRFGTHQVLQAIDLQIQTPKILALVAPNGSGKSTLLNIITNLLKPDSGSVKVFDHSNTDAAIFKQMTYLQDNRVLFNDLSGAAHVRLVQDVYGLPQSEVDQLLARLDMTAYIHKKVAAYSLGMKQHLLFLLAILPKPKLLLLDEPLNGLDPVAVRTVQQILQELYQQGTTILFSSHNLAQIDQLTDQVIFLHGGQLVAASTLRQDKQHYDLVFTDVHPVQQYLAAQDLAASLKQPHKLSVDLSASQHQQLVTWTKANGIEILDEEHTTETTDELYFHVFGEDAHETL